ncbi:D-alanyl-D-alanine-carboxypeptidase/endopeptidase AmpH [Chromobacterium sp. IIBBL 290-4]|uniref:D-alanyl-D-alanine- carboxypeptidase/endopeptidase AmpH n=1 Tax=Chromobacterium sp. IIBBL 290-4 TaxID=2953890 RepID=UPI0020B712BA|nr:D-alanyl-D-alanine-carboxypeptidase/endopeptidase AmpH [Chromobacterium sp. IIBBL 290-4]UTH73488.1 D-alanyl-D-alanine-carboxypeptidase/endopeptidase AmpH [Chromobacterium sp. IIBBL 290-4]
MKKILSLSVLLALAPSLAAAQAGSETTEQMVDRYAAKIYRDTRAVGMVMVAVRGNETFQRFQGQTKPGNRQPPDTDTVVRLASVSKTMTGEVLAALAQDRKVSLNDPLQKYAPAGFAMPAGAQSITLLNLATHTSGFPREMPGNKPENTPVFVWPDRQQRWDWLANNKSKYAAGNHAQYSNLAFDFLADALAVATGRPYAALLRDKVTAPLGMKDTTLTPNASQCARLMEGYGASPCLDTTAASGSGGIYSTPRDMQRWLQDLVQPQNPARRQLHEQIFQMHYKRNDLRYLRGMDVAGQADDLGLAWIRMEPSARAPEIIQKTAGGGGFIGYVAIAPKQNVAVWVSLTRSGGTHFGNMSNGVNQLVAEMSGFQPVAAVKPAAARKKTVIAPKQQLTSAKKKAAAPKKKAAAKSAPKAKAKPAARKAAAHKAKKAQ